MWRSLALIAFVGASAAFAIERAGKGPAGGASHDAAWSDDRERRPAGRLAQTGRLTLDQIAVQEHSAGRPWSVTRTNDAVCFEVRQGERRQKGSERRRPIERSEIALRERLRFGVDYEVHYEFMVTPGPPSAAAWVNVGQLHSSPDPGDANGLGPLFAVQFNRERMRIVARADPRRASPGRPADLWLYRDEADMVRGRWYRMDVEIRVDPTGGGRLVVWRDGRELANYAGPLGYNDALGPYWKLGIYRKSSPEPLTVCYRGFTLAEATGAPRATP